MLKAHYALWILIVLFTLSACIHIRPVVGNNDPRATPQVHPIILKRNPGPYILRTRILVEENSNGERVVNPDDILDDLVVAEALLQEIQIKFTIIDIVPVVLDEFWYARLLEDNTNYSDHLNIYYLFDKPEFSMLAGRGSFPWAEANEQRGIFLFGETGTRVFGKQIYWGRTHDTLAHEIGHICGLLHTGEFVLKDDYVDDTPLGKSGNLMDVEFSLLNELTSGQVKRAKAFLLTYRRHMIENFNDF